MSADCLIIGIDISPNDVPVLTVIRDSNNGHGEREHIKTFTDDEARALYRLLTQQ